MSDQTLPVISDLATLDDVNLITLSDGTVLDDRQSLACVLRATQDIEQERIAEHAGYSSGSSVRRFLNSEKGKEGVRIALIQYLNDGAIVGLRTMMSLARSARSENVRQLAAADLLDRAGIRLAEAVAGPLTGGQRELNININLGDRDDMVTIEGSET